MMRLLSIDPGYTTGAVVIRYEPGKLAFDLEHVTEIPWDLRFEVAEALVNGTYDPSKDVPLRIDRVVIEQFRLWQGRAEQQSGSQFPSIQVQAIFETFIYLRVNKMGYVPIVYQLPSVMARVNILPQHGDFLGQVGGEHVKDAYKHARYYVCTLGAIDGV